MPTQTCPICKKRASRLERHIRRHHPEEWEKRFQRISDTGQESQTGIRELSVAIERQLRQFNNSFTRMPSEKEEEILMFIETNFVNYAINNKLIDKELERIVKSFLKIIDFPEKKEEIIEELEDKLIDHVYYLKGLFVVLMGRNNFPKPAVRKGFYRILYSIRFHMKRSKRVDNYTRHVIPSIPRLEEIR